MVPTSQVRKCSEHVLSFPVFVPEGTAVTIDHEKPFSVDLSTHLVPHMSKITMTFLLSHTQANGANILHKYIYMDFKLGP